jgi:hypothetical protein
MKWWIMFAFLTAFNVGWDWIFGRLGPLTLAWQCGVMSALLTAWLFSRFNSSVRGGAVAPYPARGVGQEVDHG